MPNKNSNVPYDQIPHSVINHPDTDPYHVALIRALFKILKDVQYPIVYSNESLSKDCKMSLRNVEKKMTELVKMGFINCTGRGLQRRISLGILIPTTAKYADVSNKKIPQPHKTIPTTAQNDIHNRKICGDYKITSKNNTKCEPTVFEKQEYAAGKPGYEHVEKWLLRNNHVKIEQ